MRYRFGLVFGAVLLSACGTHPFTPEEFPLQDGRVPRFGIAGPAIIHNAQPSTEPVLVYDSWGTQFTADLRSITEVMVRQTQEEVQKDGRPDGSASRKSVDLRVKALMSRYIFFFWKSRIEFDARLGNGETLVFTVKHASGTLGQDLDGCIAEGVATLLNDPRVKAYLASGPTSRDPSVSAPIT